MSFMHITLIHPSVGKTPGKKYIRAWQMEPLPMAQVAALTPKDVQISFWDDRMEEIPFGSPTDLVAISIETYTARRSYEISTEFRRRNVPVLMGGFHASLCPDEVAEYADIVVSGQIENIWHSVIEDFKNGKELKFYRSEIQCPGIEVFPDRSIYAHKNYLKITLLETGRGCRFRCEFCAIQKFYNGEYTHRKIETVVEEIRQLKFRNKLFFFVDDNLTANPVHAKKLLEAIKPLKIKWVGQADITISRDAEMLKLMAESGCVGILIGFESLNIDNLRVMNKSFNKMEGGADQAVRKIHKAGIRLYVTFLFGYDHDRLEDFDKVYQFCRSNKIFIVAFNHLTPFPGTELYERLQKNNLLLFDKWWLDKNYLYGQLPFKTKISPEIIEKECQKARKKFYSFSSILYRMTNFTNINRLSVLFFYLAINLLLKKDSTVRYTIHLGDSGFKGDLLKVKEKI